jgi:hypothetical protein
MILKALSNQLVALVFDYAQQKCDDEADFILFKNKVELGFIKQRNTITYKYRKNILKNFG